MAKNPGSSRDEGEMFEDEETRLNPYSLMGSSGERIWEASHVLFRVGSAWVLDQSLIERSCDWLLLCVCSGVKEVP